MRSSCFDGQFIIRLKFLGSVWDGWCLPVALVEETRVLANMLVSLLIGPIFPIAITLIYYDQRIRKEGYDIERMMDTTGLNAPALPDAAVAEGSAEAEVQPG
jgi:hypothetical protein